MCIAQCKLTTRGGHTKLFTPTVRLLVVEYYRQKIHTHVIALWIGNKQWWQLLFLYLSKSQIHYVYNDIEYKKNDKQFWDDLFLSDNDSDSVKSILDKLFSCCCDKFAFIDQFHLPFNYSDQNDLAIAILQCIFRNFSSHECPKKHL